MATCIGRLQNWWKLGQKFTTLPTSVLMKFVISPVLYCDNDVGFEVIVFPYTEAINDDFIPMETLLTYSLKVIIILHNIVNLIAIFVRIHA